MMIHSNEIRQALKTGTHTVKFTKANGEERDMTCTLDMTFIPEAHAPQDPSKSYHEESVKVFDVNLQEWRSFRFDRVKNFDGNDLTVYIDREMW